MLKNRLEIFRYFTRLTEIFLDKKIGIDEFRTLYFELRRIWIDLEKLEEFKNDEDLFPYEKNKSLSWHIGDIFLDLDEFCTTEGHEKEQIHKNFCIDEKELRKRTEKNYIELKRLFEEEIVKNNE
jgi:hypothetical protein